MVTGQACLAQHMSLVTRLEFSNKCPGLEIEIACDVTSPFTGPNGAVHVFSRQKGATPQMQDEVSATLRKGKPNERNSLRACVRTKC
jgi:glycerate kinase